MIDFVHLYLLVFMALCVFKRDMQIPYSHIQSWVKPRQWPFSCVCVCVCVCMYETKKEASSEHIRGGETDRRCVHEFMYTSKCVCVCVWVCVCVGVCVCVCVCVRVL